MPLTHAAHGHGHIAWPCARRPSSLPAVHPAHIALPWPCHAGGKAAILDFNNADDDSVADTVQASAAWCGAGAV